MAEIRLWDDPIMVAADGRRIEVHATRTTEDNRMVAILSPAQATGIAEVFDLVGAHGVAEELREASAWCEAQSTW